MDGTSEVLLNEQCKDVSSPEMCPNTWMYIDANSEWKIDSELNIGCGRFYKIHLDFIRQFNLLY